MNINELKKKIEETNCFFFDLDGTLIDTEKIYFKYWKIASKKYGYELSDEEALNMRSLDGRIGKEFIKEISDGILDYTEVRNERIKMMNDYFSFHPIEIKPFAIELLEFLRRKNKQIYIVTANSLEKSEGILNKTGLYKYVDGVVSTKEAKIGKPYPDAFLIACSKVNLPPKEVVVFEDSPNGLKASKAAGCYTVMVEDMSTYNETMDYVDASIKNFKELL